MDLEKLKIFFAVAQGGSISAAAEQLNVAQSTVSRSIALLEADLNTKLFIRPGGAKGVSLSDTGQILLKAATQVIDITSRASQTIDDHNKQPTGPLKIITTTGVINVWLAECVKNFVDSYPELYLILEGRDDSLDLDASDADAAIRPFVPNAPHLIQSYLLTYHLKMYASPEYLKKFGVPKTPQDLNQHRIITFSTERSSPLGNVDWLLQVGANPAKPRRPFLQVNSSLALKQFAEQGLGIISLAAEFPGLSSSNLVEVLPDLDGYHVDIYYVFHENLRNSKRVTAFGNFLAASVK